MKNIFKILIFNLFAFTTYAQQATEIDSKSVRLPRYTNLAAITNITTGITTPTQGMMVYNIETASNWYYNGAAWTNTLGAFSAPLSLNLSAIAGTTISGSHTNSGSAVAIGGYGVSGTSTGGELGAGVLGVGNAANYGISGYSPDFIGVYGSSNNGIGGKFTGTTALSTDGALRFGGSGVGTIATGKVLTSDALGNATWQNPTLVLPYSQVASSSNSLLDFTNTYSVPPSSGRHSAIRGVFSGGIVGTPPTDLAGYGSGIVGIYEGSGALLNSFSSGVYGRGSNKASGVFGESNGNSNSIGTYGVSDIGSGVSGFSGNGIGVSGLSNSGYGGYFSSTSGYSLITGTGKVGIGISNPTAQLQVLSSIGTGIFSENINSNAIFTYSIHGKITGFGSAVYGEIIGNGNGVYGSSSIGYGVYGFSNSGIGGSFSSGSGYALITGTGNVGIGTATPTAKLEVSGYSKLGDDATAPKIKMKELAVFNSAATYNGQSPQAHGLTSSKIISVSVLLEWTPGYFVPVEYSSDVNLKYNYFISPTEIIVQNNTPGPSCPYICGKPVKVLITYKE